MLSAQIKALEAQPRVIIPIGDKLAIIEINENTRNANMEVPPRSLVLLL